MMGRSSSSNSRSKKKNNPHSHNHNHHPWSDWLSERCHVDALFGCDSGKSALLPSHTAAAALSADANYELLHDEFLESLLAEQSKLSRDRPPALELSNSELTASTIGTELIEEEDDEHDDGENNNNNSNKNGGDTASLASLGSHAVRKRRRLLRRSRSSPPRSRGPPRRSRSMVSECSSRSVVSLHALAESTQPMTDPSIYLHPLVRMQKDKGRGEPVGACICAKGRDACMEKLRAKMALLTDVVMDERRGPATMKRRKARTAAEYDNFCETRSLIELKLGFLSMTYGVLLRWDKGKTAQVTLVVLRKMCSESFYPTKSVTTSLPTSSSSSKGHESASPSSSSHPHVVADKHAILQRHDGTEVTLLEPPYYIPRPAQFGPTQLTVTTLYAAGLSRKSNWTVKLAYDGHSESILLTFDEHRHCFVPKLGEALVYTSKHYQHELQTLDITLYEHRLRSRSYRRHVCSMQVPLANMDPQPSSSRKLTRLVLPCKHDADATVAIGVVLQSDYVHWARQELELRRREELRSRRPFTMQYNRNRHRQHNGEDDYRDDNEDMQQDDDPWDWIYSICVC